MAFILMANIFTLVTDAIVNEFSSDLYNQLKHEKLSRQQAEDRYHRDIAILNYKDIEEYYHRQQAENQEDT